MTRYKWYDYKHTMTAYTKQLTNHNKQTDNTQKTTKTKTNKHERNKPTNKPTKPSPRRNWGKKK